MKRILLLIATLALVTLGFPALSAAQAPVIGPGTAWTTNATPPPDRDQTNPATRDACTMAVVGTDAAGNKVGFSAAHCISNVADGADLYAWTPTAPRPKIGTVVWRNTAADFVVFRFDPTTVISAQGPRVKIDSLGTLPTSFFGPQVCKDGLNSGRTCGRLIYYNADEYVATNTLQANDSGGPGFVGTGWTGIGLASYLGTGWSRYVPATKVLSVVNGQANPVGKGFTVAH